MSTNHWNEEANSSMQAHLHVVADYAEVSRLAADVVARVVTDDPEAAITLPTGETPRGMYEELVRRIQAAELDFSRAHFFCLDDYLGKGIDDQASLTAWLNDVGEQFIPDQDMSMGIGTILEAGLIVLIVSGAAKADILQATLEGPISSDVPGSFLQTVGDRLIVLADREAASKLG